MRTSIAIEVGFDSASPAPRDEPKIRILVDTPPDFRSQALRAGFSRIDAVLFTHTHADHIFGIDDLRSFNFTQGSEIPVYGSSDTCASLLRQFRYAFHADPSYEGGAPPRLTLHPIEPYVSRPLQGIPVLPLPLLHGKMEVYGFRVGNFAYLTDCNYIPPESRERLAGLDVLLLDGLRHRPHRTHFTIEEAVREVEQLQPRRTFLTHLSHEVEHDEANTLLRSLTSCNVELAYDGLVLLSDDPQSADAQCEPGTVE